MLVVTSDRDFASFVLLNMTHTKVLSVLPSTHHPASALLTHFPTVKLTYKHCFHYETAGLCCHFWPPAPISLFWPKISLFPDICMYLEV
jgi:hypothetical protein